jgi:Holliday junction resolvase
MTERGRLEESLHYLMIKVLVESLEKEGFEVNADHMGSLRTRPDPVGGFIPDIEAHRGDDVRLIEVETQSTIDLPETHEQLAKLTSSTRGKTYLAIPFDCIEGARQVRDELSIDFVILPCYPMVGYVGTPK